ncbi:hypothetical protein V6N11_067043 [Hibiscus sabdariffa]|uniref:Uncharacterized protein n=1 Tax=Hibiscus sabdariffa TaxID=183260 RepID=A0ABR2SQC4_9ROSI
MGNACLVFDESPLRDAVSHTALITGYIKCWTAGALFDEFPVRDVVSWNTMIAGYVNPGMKEVPGCSSIEVDRAVHHEFLVHDKVQPHCKEIYDMLDEVDVLSEKAGFVLDTSEALQDMDEEWKQGYAEIAIRLRS